MTRPRRILFPRQREIPLGEPYPSFEPPFRDQDPPPYRQDVQEWFPFSSGKSTHGITREQVHKAKDLVLAHPEVQKRLNNKQHTTLGVSLLDDKKGKPESGTLLYLIYNYTDNHVIEILLDRGASTVLKVAIAHYQPPPTEEEIQRAIKLAQTHEGLAANLTEDLIGMAILVSAPNPADPNFGHRLFDVRFGRSDERLPKFKALVNLSTSTVVQTGSVCSNCLKEGGAK